jgi:hypothetical protein
MKGYSTDRKLAPKGVRLHWVSVKDAKNERVSLVVRNVKKGEQIVSNISGNSSTKPSGKILVP